MRPTTVLLRGSKGYSWYQNFLKHGKEAFQKYSPPTPFDWSANNVARPKAYFNVKIENEEAGKLVVELAEDIVPRNVDNFKRLCRGEGVKFPGYKGSKIHLLRKGEVAMGGDIEHFDGRGSHSAYAERYLKDENFIIPHSSRGLISMASVGIHTNGSQFYITFAPAPHLDGRCTVIGRVVDGENVLKAIEGVFTARSSPARAITIEECGVIDANK